jgi:hypothetical protein
MPPVLAERAVRQARNADGRTAIHASRDSNRRMLCCRAFWKRRTSRYIGRHSDWTATIRDGDDGEEPGRTGRDKADREMKDNRSHDHRSDLVSAHRYSSVGKCIYCGESSSKLTAEHPVPYGLGGRDILPDASCEDCARVTGTQVEGPVLQKMLIAPRTHWKIPTRRPKERPTPLAIGVGIPEEDFQWRSVLIADHPLAFSLPIFPPPGIRRNEPLRRELHLIDTWNHVSGDAEQRLKRQGENAGMWQVYNPHLFCRMLAKITHAYAAAEIGVDNFIPFLPGIIIGRSEAISHYVGCSPEPELRSPANDDRIELRHELALRYFLASSRPPILSATVQLFASLHAPEYEIIVGQMLSETVEGCDDQ